LVRTVDRDGGDAVGDGEGDGHKTRDQGKGTRDQEPQETWRLLGGVGCKVSGVGTKGEVRLAWAVIPHLTQVSSRAKRRDLLTLHTGRPLPGEVDPDTRCASAK